MFLYTIISQWSVIYACEYISIYIQQRKCIVYILYNSNTIYNELYNHIDKQWTNHRKVKEKNTFR